MTPFPGRQLLVIPVLFLLITILAPAPAVQGTIYPQMDPGDPDFGDDMGPPAWFVAVFILVLIISIFSWIMRLSGGLDSSGSDSHGSGTNPHHDSGGAFPRKVVDAVHDFAAGGSITELEQDYKNGRRVYEAEIKKAGRELKLTLDVEGNILETKEMIDVSSPETEIPRAIPVETNDSFPVDTEPVAPSPPPLPVPPPWQDRGAGVEASKDSNCPGCGRAVDDDWDICQYCMTGLKR